MMTVEACVILPLALMVTFLLFWTGILLYDRAVVNYAVSAAVIRGSRMAERSNEEISGFVQKKIEELTEDKLVLMERPQMEVRVEYGKIYASLSGNLRAPILAGFCGNWSVEACRDADRMRVSRIVRTLQRLDRLADREQTDAETEKQEEQGGTEK